MYRLIILLLFIVGCSSEPGPFKQGQFVRLKLLPEAKLLIIKSLVTSTVTNMKCVMWMV